MPADENIACVDTVTGSPAASLKIYVCAPGYRELDYLLVNHLSRSRR